MQIVGQRKPISSYRSICMLRIDFYPGAFEYRPTEIYIWCYIRLLTTALHIPYSMGYLKYLNVILSGYPYASCNHSKAATSFVRDSQI